MQYLAYILHLRIGLQKCFVCRRDASVFRLSNVQNFQRIPRTRNLPFIFLVIIWVFLHDQMFFLFHTMNAMMII